MNKEIEKLSKEIWEIYSLFLYKSKESSGASMAVTKMHPIKSTLNLAIDYIIKSEKLMKKLSILMYNL